METDTGFRNNKEFLPSRERVTLLISVEGIEIRGQISPDLNKELMRHITYNNLDRKAVLHEIYALKNSLSEEAVHGYLFGPPNPDVKRRQ